MYTLYSGRFYAILSETILNKSQTECHENVKWRNHKRLMNIKYIIHLQWFKWTYKKYIFFWKIDFWWMMNFAVF